MDGGARRYAPWTAGQGVMRHGRRIKAGFVKHRKLKKHNSYSILVMQRSEHESMCAPETGTYGPYSSHKSVLSVVCVSTMLTVEMLLLYVVWGRLHVRIY